MSAARDEELIRRTLALYSRYNDYKDEEAWTLLYAPDAVVSLGGHDWPVRYAPEALVMTPTGHEWRGRNAIRAFIRDINTHHNWDTCHLSGNVVIAIDGDTARLDADMLFHERQNGEAVWRNGQFNRYTADLVRAGSGWLFTRWVIQPRLTITSRSASLAAAPPLPGVGEIHKTLALYAHFLDDRDADNWSNLFTVDGTLTLRSGALSGRKAIRDAAEQMWARDPERCVIHFCTTSVVRPSGMTATAETEVSEYEPAGDGTWRARGHGRYFDRLVKDEARWLIFERNVDWPR
jgi:uncharacterized protein (TIGR02246 family)